MGTTEVEVIPSKGHAYPGEIRAVECSAGSTTVELVDDPYSDRLRCDHPGVDDAATLASLLKEQASAFGRQRVVTFVREEISPGLEDAGFCSEGVIPGFYRGEQDCEVMGWSQTDERLQPGDPKGAALTERILEEKRGSTSAHIAVPTERAEPEDAAEIAALLETTFAEYPTPSSDPEYIADSLESGTLFRVIRKNDRLAACASADLVPEAATAELTDCATRPECRGQGYMQAILRDLMDDLRAKNYPTAFTLARAVIPGVNIAFQRLGFEFQGRMAQSCRIGEGLEDMNIWSRRL